MGATASDVFGSSKSFGLNCKLFIMSAIFASKSIYKSGSKKVFEKRLFIWQWSAKKLETSLVFEEKNLRIYKPNNTFSIIYI